LNYGERKGFAGIQDNKQDGSLVTKSLTNGLNMLKNRAGEFVGRASMTGNKRIANHE
jgi:hypothetical protein